MNKNLSFLVVDDDVQAVDVVVNYLKSAGFEWIYTFNDGKNALEFLEKHTVSIIISDWEMSGMNGLELLKAVRKHPTLSATPFIMIASQTSHEKIKVTDAKNTGVDAYLIKPFRKFMLLEKIEQVLFEHEWTTKRGALVIDDDPSVRDFVSSAMQSLGFAPVHVAADGDAGFRLLESRFDEISVVICDWDMPKMTGIELLRKVRSTSALSRIPFVMATAQIPGKEVTKVKSAIESDVDHYLLKPFRLNDLKEKVEMALAKARAKAFPKHLLSIAYLALESGDPESAEKLFMNVINKFPDKGDAYLGLAKSELAQDEVKNFDKVIKNIQRAIHVSPTWPEPHIYMAHLFEEKMSLDKAIECLKAAVKKCTVSADLHYHLGRLLCKRGKTDLGVDELNRALEINPDHPEANAMLGGPKKKDDTK